MPTLLRPTVVHGLVRGLVAALARPPRARREAARGLTLALGAAALALALAPGGARAQAAAAAGAGARRPTTAPAPYVVRRGAELAALVKSLPPGGTQRLVEPLPQVPIEVDMRHEKNKEQTQREVHDDKDHLLYVVAGALKVGLGGELESPREVAPRDWRSPSAKGAKMVDLKKGDMVFIPQGTVHWRDVRGSEATIILMSFWPRGLPAKQP